MFYLFIRVPSFWLEGGLILKSQDENFKHHKIILYILNKSIIGLHFKCSTNVLATVC